ncbi:hypothetical protein CspeluHIS016_0208280 [Cutaneotrichosporon spelunceum]|uniref:Decapping nuclease n=1 Tax=Cutaneotrichosporon spelunceum TaxID=1672016 RepID=A0AAD3TS06_9TREE|nr:hypothetical protein CspeluHIS016_0208280 [Cutaneotrichosporon spelunceum]
MQVASLPLPPTQLPPPPAYRQPVLVTTYSHLPDRRLEAGDASMAYLRPGGALPGSDLEYGFEDRIERDEALEEHLDGMCWALRSHDHPERKGGVVSWRGMMTRIMTAPFEDREGWEMRALALGGSVYLEQWEEREGGQSSYKAKNEAQWALQGYMGYAYEAYATVPEAEDGPEGWSGTVNTNVQWCNVVRSAIGDVPILIGGEVDCVRAPVGAPNPGLDATVELKTNKVVDSERADRIFLKKLLKHWAQSFLLGVPTVDVGFRTDAGILESRHEFDTATIPDLAARGGAYWKPAPCLHFLYAVLSMLVRQVLPTDPVVTGAADGLEGGELPPAHLFSLRFTPRHGVELVSLGEVEFEPGQRWGGILPADYVAWRLARGYE